jgi:hypothetical protein
MFVLKFYLKGQVTAKQSKQYYTATPDINAKSMIFFARDHLGKG